MSRRWLRSSTWLLLLPLLCVLLLPLTEKGSGLLLDAAALYLPVDIEYRSGTLAGELALRRFAWSDEDIALDLQDIVLELEPACLWRSAICFRQLRARRLDIQVLPGSPEAAVAAAGPDTFEFPLPLAAAALRLDALRVAWQGGEWRQGTFEAAVEISGHAVRVDRATAQAAELNLVGGEPVDAPFALPEISLPVELQVGELVLENPGWNIDGSRDGLDTLRLRGSWFRRELRLDELQVVSAQWGKWACEGSLAFAGRWPLSMAIRGFPAEFTRWPELLERTIAISVDGNPAALDLEMKVAGQASAAASGQVNLLEPQLPFSFVAQADWPGAVDLSTQVELPGLLADATLSAPLQLAASGSLEEQVFQLEARGSALGYEALGVQLAGSHGDGRLEFDTLRLQDLAGKGTVWGSATVAYAEQLQWSAALESADLELPLLSPYGGGRVEGRLQLRGYLSAGEWQVMLEDARLDGTVNDLPARVRGFAGVDHQLHLLPSELQVDVNGARLSLLGDGTSPGRLELELAELGRWLTGSRGSVSLQASLPPDWREFSLAGSLQDVAYNGFSVADGQITGGYVAGQEGEFDLALDLSGVMAGEVELENLRLHASGSRAAQTLSLRSRGEVEGLLEIVGEAGAEGSWSGRLAATTLQTAEGNWYLGQPVSLRFSPSPASLSIEAHCWQYLQTRVCPGEIVLAREGSASLALAGGLETLAVFLPVYLQVTGAVQAEFAARWAPGRPLALDGQLRASDLVVTRDFGGGESGTASWERLDAEVRSDTRGLAVIAHLNAGGRSVLGLDLRLPAERAGALAGTLDIAGLQLATLAPFAPTLSVLEGDVRGQLQLGGTLRQPLANGVLRLSKGRLGLLGNPTELEQFELALSARGDRARLEGSGLLGGGRLQISGELLSQPDWRLQLDLVGEKHALLLPPYTQMVVSEQLQLAISGGLLDLAGSIVVHEGELEQDELPEGSVTLSDDVVEVDLEGNVIYEPSPFAIGMDVAVRIEDRFRILGDVVDATVGGDLQLRRERGYPLQVFGNLNVIGGQLRAYGQRLRIQRGTVSFAGNPDNPELDVRAQREIAADNVTVGLQLQGTVKEPQLEVFSDPVMSQGEAMSYLVRGRGLDTSAAADGTAMALSLGSTLVNQSPLVAELNRIPGISNLAFGAEGSTEADTAATLGGYIGERLYLSYGMGVYEPINVLIVRLYLQTRLWLEVVSRLENSVDLYYSFDID